MTEKTDNWSKTWKSSEQPSKQRKYRANAPMHVKEKIVSANLSTELRDEMDTRSIPLRRGDQIKVMRGDRKGDEGIVSKINRDEEKVYVNGIELERNDGTLKEVPLRPSNLQVTAINIEDDRRVEKYDIDDFGLVEVDEEEMEEVLEEDEESEMMEQMQQQKDTADKKDEEDEDTEEEEEVSEVNYSDITDNNISDAKEELQDLEDPDYKAALKAEEDGKDRKTFKEWLENKVEEDDTQ